MFNRLVAAREIFDLGERDDKNYKLFSRLPNRQKQESNFRDLMNCVEKYILAKGIKIPCRFSIDSLTLHGTVKPLSPVNEYEYDPQSVFVTFFKPSSLPTNIIGKRQQNEIFEEISREIADIVTLIAEEPPACGFSNEDLRIDSGTISITITSNEILGCILHGPLSGRRFCRVPPIFDPLLQRLPRNR